MGTHDTCLCCYTEPTNQRSIDYVNIMINCLLLLVHPHVYNQAQYIRTHQLTCVTAACLYVIVYTCLLNVSLVIEYLKYVCNNIIDITQK